MMTVVWFLLSALMVVIAVALLAVDRRREPASVSLRDAWVQEHDYAYVGDVTDLMNQFYRGLFVGKEDLPKENAVQGAQHGELFYVFDIPETATVIAVEREYASDVNIDLRLNTSTPPQEEDLELLGSIGDRIFFSSHVEIARRACDQRFVDFVSHIPRDIDLLWTEGEWTFASMDLDSTSQDWDMLVDQTVRLSEILHVLPPATQ